MVSETYLKYKDEIKTGDLIFFQSTGFISDMIRHVTGSNFSHVGMALRTKIRADDELKLFIVESTTINPIPDENGKIKRGCQMSLMDQRVTSPKSKIWWCPLAVELTDSEKEKVACWLLKAETSNVKYDFIQAAISGIKLPRILSKILFWGLSKKSLSRMFCSEMITAALQEVEKVAQTINPSSITPEDAFEFECLSNTRVQLCANL